MTSPLDAFLAAYDTPAVLPTHTGSPSFTVIVRTQGNRPGSLAEALRSLADQTHGEFDVVVVVHADAPTADSVRAQLDTSAPEELADRLTVVGVQGGGRSTPLNTGLEHVTGSHFCFLDDDDLAYDSWLATFAGAIADQRTSIVRAITETQAWSCEGGTEPVRPVGAVERPYPEQFDLLAHMSLNLTPICALAFPRSTIDELGLRFCDDLAVYEDWDFLMRAAMALGVVSVPVATTLYRRLDTANADSAETVATWERAHALVIDRLSAHPVLLPAGDARRLAGTHFVTGARSRHEVELAAAEADLDQLTRSPLRWLRAFSGRLGDSLRHRIAARRP